MPSNLEYSSFIFGICRTIHIFAFHNQAYYKNGNYYYFDFRYLRSANLGV